MKVALYQLVGYESDDGGMPCSGDYDNKPEWVRVSEFVEVDFPMLENVDFAAAKQASKAHEIANLEEKLKKLKGAES